MHTQARFFIRTALIYALIGFSIGGLVLINQGLNLSPKIAVLLPVFYHLLMVGWATQLIAGVAVWMFPVHSKEQPRGNETLGWIVYGALNLGLLLRITGEPLQAWGYSSWGWAVAASAVLQVAAIWLLVLTIWPRVKGRAMAKKGEK